ncbi:hypothetical protein CHS0354_011871 [Potamilus streckersoni]|uniref:RNA polymerase II subunit B1 CTD phosphatase RPAP2 homolog n=1 Tax=Potamilus streckersoni TaxID=2493646 RepID=A0AAE0T5T8_9BIVA|nr:hypothetical protein CHS0354_011871 [Potamilus streckersoni]
MDKAEIERRARKQVSCEEKAFRIVERLLDNPITEEFLTDVAHYITPSHYADVVEERGIANQCGYPLCPNQLGNVPKKKFHISTKTNKVYDISQRKNFCSNRCYQASILFEKQISSSPVWSRDDEPRVKFKLLPLDGMGGLVGDVVISPAMEVKAEYEQLKKLEKYEEVLSHKKEQIKLIARSDEKESHIRYNAESQNKEVKRKEHDHLEAFTKHADEAELNVDSELSESVKKLHLNMETQEKIESCAEAKSEKKIVKESDSKSVTGLCNSSSDLMTEIGVRNAGISQENKSIPCSARKSKVFKPKAKLSDSVQPSGMSKTEYLMKLLDKKKHLLSKMVQLESLDVKPKSESAQTENTSSLATVFLKPDSNHTCLKSRLNHSDCGDSELDTNTKILVLQDVGKATSIQLSQADHCDKKSENCSQAHHGDKSKYDLNYCYGNKNEQNFDGHHDKFDEEDSQEKPSLDEMICNNTETKPLNSLEAVTNRSSAKIVETQPVPHLDSSQSTPANPVRATPLALICQNMFEWLTKETIDYLGLTAESSKNKLPEGFHKQYAALTKRLDAEERDLEDILGEETMEERKDTAAKPLPDITKLKEETRAFELKVIEFYRGASSSSKKKTRGEVAEPEGIIVLPTVDSHDQMLIRRKIVMDRLSKVIPELLPPLKITLQDVFTELKELVATFSLTSKNIFYKPAEWMLVCLILLKMLSKKMKALEDSFRSASSEKYFTILLKGIGESPVTLDHYVVDMLHQRKQSY